MGKREGVRLAAPAGSATPPSSSASRLTARLEVRDPDGHYDQPANSEAAENQPDRRCFDSLPERAEPDVVGIASAAPVRSHRNSPAEKDQARDNRERQRVRDTRANQIPTAIGPQMTHPSHVGLLRMLGAYDASTFSSPTNGDSSSSSN